MCVAECTSTVLVVLFTSVANNVISTEGHRSFPMPDRLRVGILLQFQQTTIGSQRSLDEV